MSGFIERDFKDAYIRMKERALDAEHALDTALSRIRELESRERTHHDAIYKAVLLELETKRRMPTSVSLAIDITNAIAALSSKDQEKTNG